MDSNHDIIFPLSREPEYRSYIAGRSFGKLFFTVRSTLTAFQLERLVSTLCTRGTRKLVPDFYRLGFYHSYSEETEKVTGNRLPVSEKQASKETIIMGKLNNAIQNTRQEGSFVKAAELATHKANFCITAISSFDGNFGPQWMLTLLVDPAVIGKFDETEPAEVKMSFQKAKGASNTRDRALQYLLDNDELPAHNCTIIERELKNAATYFDLIEDAESTVCPCGHIVEVDDADDDNNPF